LAAVFGEVCEHTIHLAKFHPINQVSTVSLLADQSGIHQLFEVKRQGGVGYA
jgi:hypothetical protein